MIFLASIYGLALNIKRTDADHARKLSTVMNIARQPAALDVPIAIKSVIWYRKLPGDIQNQDKVLRVTDLVRLDLTPEDVETISTRILECAPKWLHYAKPSQMKLDIRLLARHLRDTQTVTM